MAAESAGRDLLLSVFNHTTLPARLPGKQDFNLDEVEQTILGYLINATKQITSFRDNTHAYTWDRLRRALETCKHVNAGGELTSATLLSAFRELQIGDFIIMHVGQQNAGIVLARRRSEGQDEVTFEAFEASPRSRDVIAAVDTMLRDFPGCAAKMPFSTFDDLEFQTELAALLSSTSKESTKQLAATTEKAGSKAFEGRDTSHPALITDVLMTIIARNGSVMTPTILRKHVRDEVSWDHGGADTPWRRCPFWMVLRVATQRWLYTIHGDELGRLQYKLLMALFFSMLLQDCNTYLDLEHIHHLNSKLCRRVAKLQGDEECFSPSLRAEFNALSIVREECNRTTSHAVDMIGRAWETHKADIKRPVFSVNPNLILQHLNLQLLHSEKYLRQVLKGNVHGRASQPTQLPQNFQPSSEVSQPALQFAATYYNLAIKEDNFRDEIVRRLTGGLASVDLDTECQNLSKQIIEYLDQATTAYSHDSEQTSTMLLTVMELWMYMDMVAIQQFPLLTEYSPAFHAEILNVLLISSLKDMQRVQKLRFYLQRRHRECKNSNLTIFADPQEGCFAERYFKESESHEKLFRCDQEIRSIADKEHAEKKLIWENKTAEYEGLRVRETQTLHEWTVDHDGVPQHDRGSCTLCYLGRRKKRCKATIHEYPLPDDSIQARTLVFELNCPAAFSAYRNATWQIICHGRTGSSKVAMLVKNFWLDQYPGLATYLKSEDMKSDKPIFCLASSTKSFSATHYAHPSIPCRLDKDVCVSNGLTLCYYGLSHKFLPSDILNSDHRPTFAHLCKLTLPPESPFSDLNFSTKTLNSYEIIANQSKCPSGANIHEYIAFQTLPSGSYRRWIQILVELGSSNVNFSAEATSSLMNMLALQIGPSPQCDELGTIHGVFQDELFCTTLLHQLHERLKNIASNWRETNCLETIITLALRVFEIGGSTSASGQKLLEKIRQVTMGWISALRFEIRSSVDETTSQRWSVYALWAALLCRRTFTTFSSSDMVMDRVTLQDYITSTIALQENLPGNPATLPVVLQHALIRDFKLARRLWKILRRSLDSHPEALTSSVSFALYGSQSEDTMRTSQLRFLSFQDTFFVEFTIDATEDTASQTVHFHVLEGHLFVDGKSMGKLPPEWRSDPVLKQLFGDQSLLTFPSSMSGMSYQLAITPHGHKVHVGYRNGSLIVRAIKGTMVYELIPRVIFGKSNTFDLPAPLVDSCVHWLDVRGRIVLIRPEATLWKPGFHNWSLSIDTRRATRKNRCRNPSVLIDPYSETARQVTQIFKNFEDPRHLLISADENNRILVDLRQLELQFFVNDRHLLQCRQLKAEIDPNQDAGTWYGLASKIVLRDIIKFEGTENNQRPENFHWPRSIIVPTGPITSRISRSHVIVDVENTGNYARFFINDVLGRLECPADPRLVYMKALYHAHTSFILPDPLTNRTGTEEALHCLRSAVAQPWAPLTSTQFHYLVSISQLTPRREYYPAGFKTMQQTTWNSKLTTIIQDETYRSAVLIIRDKSEALRQFTPGAVELPQIVTLSVSDLNTRAWIRRATYRRVDNEELGSIHKLSQLPLYVPRDHMPSSGNVLQVVDLIRQEPENFAVSTRLNLAQLLNSPEENTVIEGQVKAFSKSFFTEKLDTELGSAWGSLVAFSREVGSSNKYKLMFLFATLAYNHTSERDFELLQAMIAFAFLEPLRSIEPDLRWEVYDRPVCNEVPSMADIFEQTKPYMKPYPVDEDSQSDVNPSSRQRHQLLLAKTAHQNQASVDAQRFAEMILRQWPCEEPELLDLPAECLVEAEGALNAIKTEWLRMYKNYEFFEYIAKVHQVLKEHHDDTRVSVIASTYQSEQQLHMFSSRSRLNDVLTLGDILSNSTVMNRHIPPITYAQPVNGYNKTDNLRQFDETLYPECHELGLAIGQLKSASSLIRMQYGNDLENSLQAYKLMLSNPTKPVSGFPYYEIAIAINSARQELLFNVERMYTAFQNTYYSSRVFWLQRGSLWPCQSPICVLESLRSISNVQFGDGIKGLLIDWASSITRLQQMYRIEEAYLKVQPAKLKEELCNMDYRNWSPSEYPDWLLLELDSDIKIRPQQVDVALATINPASQSNSTLQMNMGQGKTSCIMPMAAVVLADGESLMRVVVPKALLLQTAQLFHGRLGNLLGRELCHIPFSRKTPVSMNTISNFQRVYQRIQAASGIIITLPEHILSFMLSGVQRLEDGKLREAKAMMNVQEWLDIHARDILDECDNILAPRTQLIYPSGLQKTVDGHPQRWKTVEAILKTVHSHLHDLQKKYPKSIEVIASDHGGFPVIHFLRRDVEDDLVARIVRDVIQGHGSLIPLDCSDEELAAIKQYISNPKVSSNVSEAISCIFPDRISSRKVVYLLRGLLVHRILLMTLKKRWNVQYGLHPQREPIAVPFHAKGTPSDQAEWGHPDVAIIFTCLAFYYDGLGIDHVRQFLEHVSSRDDPAHIYNGFAESSALPDSLREWAAINIDDKGQLHDIWLHLRYNVDVVDYFLNSYVFPRYAKQFEVKMQASGWDIPSFSVAASSRRNGKSLTTGFSGTNDWKGMLPLTIAQRDLAGLSHTNAEVLAYLLQPRNRSYVVAANKSGKHIKEEGLLRMLVDKKILVLIDAGAQILAMDNVSLVRAWLEIATDAPAAIYFDKHNEAKVLYRQGRQTPLLASPFAEDSGKCLVYLDEAHTRGTDLKLPRDVCGALTLGLGQTKDHTVQAAMRLRQLGTTQSIKFFAPPEVNQSIIDFRQKRPGESISSFDVVCWLLEQSCSGMELLQPLHFAQGVDFCKRKQAGIDNYRYLDDQSHREKYLSVLKQPEQQTLEQLYGANSKPKPYMLPANANPMLQTCMKELHSRRKEYEDSGLAVHASVLQEIEQEREDEHEVEVVRESQKPYDYDPLKFPGLDSDLTAFIENGKLKPKSKAFTEVFSVMGQSRIGKKHGMRPGAASGKLYVSTQFLATVVVKDGNSVDHLQRDVKWILWSPISEIAIIVNPEEAERLIPLVRGLAKNVKPRAHILTYAAPLTRKMLEFNQVNYYAVPAFQSHWEAPSWLKIELGIYAGRLYFDFAEYPLLLNFLGVSTRHDDDTEDSTARHDRHATFASKPLAFMQEWLALRRRGQDFADSPMGHVCQGKNLHIDHHFFAKHVEKISEIKRSGPLQNMELEDEEDEQGGWHEELRDDEVELGGEQGPDPDIKDKIPTGPDDLDDGDKTGSSSEEESFSGSGSGSS